MTWRLRLQPTSPGWVDMGLGVPIMDITRARTELDWTPSVVDLGGGLGIPYTEEDPRLAIETFVRALLERLEHAWSLHDLFRRFARGLEWPLVSLSLFAPVLLPSLNAMFELHPTR